MKATHSKYATAETIIFPESITLKILLTGEQTNGSQAVFEDIVEVGIGPPRHIHPEQDETFFFLEGKFDVEIDGEVHHMSPGDVAFIPRGTVHAFKNVGDKPGRLRYIFSPALTIENMFRDFYQAQIEGQDLDKVLVDIAAKHGQITVGPPL